jgi:transcriptional repressor NrdR
MDIQTSFRRICCRKQASGYPDMKCPFCTNAENKVIDSRLSKDSRAIRRRRECLACGRRFTTYEFVEEMLPTVVKKDGRREAFDRTKILTGIKKACEKRPISIDVIEKLVENVERACQDLQEKEVTSSKIGEIVMKELYELDGVAYVRFASVYRQFRDVSEFLDELKDFLKLDKGQ